MCGFISGLSVLFHWSVCLVFMSVPKCCDECSFVLNNIVWSQRVWFLHLCSFFSKLFWPFRVSAFLYRFKNYYFFSSVENVIGIFMLFNLTQKLGDYYTSVCLGVPCSSWLCPTKCHQTNSQFVDTEVLSGLSYNTTCCNWIILHMLCCPVTRPVDCL